MSFIFSEDNFNTSGDIIRHGGSAYLMRMLNQNDCMFSLKCISTSKQYLQTAENLNIPSTESQTGGYIDVCGADQHPFYDIVWEDTLSYMMPLSTTNLQLHTPPIATLLPNLDTSEFTIPSCTPSPTENLRSDPLYNGHSSTWAARNSTCAIIQPQSPPLHLSDAQKASKKIKRDQKAKATKCLYDTITIFLDDQKIEIETLSQGHNVTPKYINNIISSHTKYHTMHKVQLSNALVHAKAKEMNTSKLNPMTPYCLKTYTVLNCNQINPSVLNIPWLNYARWLPMTLR
jgi:hypothetical protein